MTRQNKKEIKLLISFCLLFLCKRHHTGEKEFM